MAGRRYNANYSGGTAKASAVAAGGPRPARPPRPDATCPFTRLARLQLTAGGAWHGDARNR